MSINWKKVRKAYKEISDEDLKAYMDDPQHCVNCGSSFLDTSEVFGDARPNGEIKENVKCHNCGSSWTDHIVCAECPECGVHGMIDSIIPETEYGNMKIKADIYCSLCGEIHKVPCDIVKIDNFFRGSENSK